MMLDIKESQKNSLLWSLLAKKLLCANPTKIKQNIKVTNVFLTNGHGRNVNNIE